MNNEQVDQNNSNYFKLISDTINNLIAHVPSNKSSNGLQQKNKQRYSDLLKRYNTFFGTIEKVGQDRMKLYKLLIGQFSSVPYYHEVKETIDNLFNTYEKISVISTEILDQIPLETIDTTEILDQIQLENKDTTQILDQIEENVNLLENLFKLFLLNRLNLYKEFFFNNVVEKDVRNPQQYRESTEFIRNEERIMMSDNGSPMDKARAELFKECRIIPYSHEIHEVDTGIILESIHSGKQRNITNELQNFRRLFIKNNEFLRETPVQEFFNMFTDNLIQQWSEFHEKFEEEGYFKMYPVNRHLLYELDTLENDNKDVIRQVIRQIGTVRGSQEEVSTTTTNNKPPFHHKKAKNMKLTQEGRKKVVRQMQQFHNEL